MAAAEGVVGTPPGALDPPAVFGVDSTAAAGSFLDDAELFSPGLMQPQKVITKPRNISMGIFEELNLSRIRKPPLMTVILATTRFNCAKLSVQARTIVFAFAAYTLRFG
jgi:hypothetical protein